jgi:P-type Mg2+ transporter
VSYGLRRSWAELRAPAELPQSRSSWPVLVMSLVIVAVGIAIPFSPIGPYLGFSKLPLSYWPLLAVTLLCYVLLTQGVKMWLARRKWI